MNEFMAKWMNKLINIGQYKFLGNCFKFEMNILTRKEINIEVFIKIINLNLILKPN
jgi:hypothetical protein